MNDAIQKNSEQAAPAAVEVNSLVQMLEGRVRERAAALEVLGQRRHVIAGTISDLKDDLADVETRIAQTSGELQEAQTLLRLVREAKPAPAEALTASRSRKGEGKHG
jgi:chromosome segregation ATPase